MGDANIGILYLSKFSTEVVGNYSDRRENNILNYDE